MNHILNHIQTGRFAGLRLSRNSTSAKRGNSRTRLRLMRLFPLLGTPSTKFYGKSRNRPMASYTICRKISLYVLPASAH
ncbi:hypothetical protein, partial [uncultured Subdoligranulum sp.]|uniref:hypothetical protein n=1 Tax=uncultured Subdoligranulum sp. TaxID=512298 RepID=UPI0025FC18C6